MKYLVWISRSIVGVLFILSGLIKLNDPVGFSFKLEEYFSEGVLHLPFLLPWALALSLVIVILEVLLGVGLLLGFKPKSTVWSLLGLTVFFTFLTFYSAYYDKVTDCGCFGDAIKLTPWQSFTKDVLLLVLLLPLLAGRKYVQPLFSPKTTISILGLALAACIALAWYVLNHLPVLDFRPYKTGTNIPQAMHVPENAPKPIYEYRWTFTVNGADSTVVTHGEYPNVQGTFVGVETRLLQKGYTPPIHNFRMEQQGQDKTDELLAKEKLILVVAYDLAKSHKDYFLPIAALAAKARKKGYTVVGVTASGKSAKNKVKETYGLDFDFYATDETTLKTIVRSNPAVLVLEKGSIRQKVHYNDLKCLRLD